MPCSACFTQRSGYDQTREKHVHRHSLWTWVMKNTDLSSTSNPSKKTYCEKQTIVSLVAGSEGHSPTRQRSDCPERNLASPFGSCWFPVLESQCWLAAPQGTCISLFTGTNLLGQVKLTALHSMNRIGQAEVGAELNWQVECQPRSLIWQTWGIEKPGTW